MRKIERIHFALREFERKGYHNINQFEIENCEYSQNFYDENILEALSQLSELFSKCKIKSLLLPGLKHNQSNFILDERLLYDLVDMHPNDSCLILQPDDCPHSPTIFNAFPHFEIALKQADLWPAVFFWTGKRCSPGTTCFPAGRPSCACRGEARRITGG